ncbi:MAG: TauD/TfdA family dioxygenase [Pseudomonadaceae bacterium]|nr:TauD/TfdA family dioxygenase [Pseudomonadaceae bacterium]
MGETQFFEVTPVAGLIGGRVSFPSLAQVVSDSGSMTALKQALFEYGVLFLPKATGDVRLFGDLARGFGQILNHGSYPNEPDDPDVQILENRAGETYKIEQWHSDMTFAGKPPSVTMVRAKVLPPVGGDTLWASAAAAYDALSTPMQAMLCELTALHDFRHGFRHSLAEPGGQERLAPMVEANPCVSHPVVLVHPTTNRRSLFVNPLFTTRIDGLSAGESRHLLEFLFRHIVRDEFTVRLTWEVDTVAIWDNRLVQHKPIGDFGPTHRVLQRATIA